MLFFIIVQFFFSKDQESRDLSLHAFESGFESMLYSVLISSAFFILGVLFVLFDIELLFLLVGVIFQPFSSLYKTFCYIFVMRFILLTLLFEWF